MQKIKKKNMDLGDIRKIVKKSGTTFYWGMRMLPKRKSNSMFVIYAFCRIVDDISDGKLRKMKKVQKLRQWKKEIENIYKNKKLTEPMANPLSVVIKEFRLQKKYFLAIIDGMEMDAREKMVSPTERELKIYCQRVATSVGLLSIKIFGADNRNSQVYAKKLGNAFQLTNILRDLKEDSDRKRSYLPKQLLKKHRINEVESKKILEHPNIRKVCSDLAKRAKKFFREAKIVIKKCDKQSLRPAAIMCDLYEEILNSLIQRGWNNVDEPIKITKAKKLWLVCKNFIV